MKEEACFISFYFTAVSAGDFEPRNFIKVKLELKMLKLLNCKTPMPIRVFCKVGEFMQMLKIPTFLHSAIWKITLNHENKLKGKGKS
jgi:hypothetical protein